jgi:hypothetical protein
MRGEPCSPGWRLSALLLGASWIVTLAVACGGGGDDVVATHAALGAGGAGGRGGAAASAAGQAAQVPSHSAGAQRRASVQPCTDEARQASQGGALPVPLRAPAVQAHELSDEALNLPSGQTGTGAVSAPMANPFEETK